MASTALFIPGFLKDLGRMQVKEKNLVVIQFSGGNDGLNTIVPFANDLYYQNRPSIAVKSEEVIKIDGQLGFNPKMTGLADLLEKGYLSVVNNVGYPNPDRSHFRSMDIWHTASSSEEYLTTGWLGRYLDNACSGCQFPHYAIEVDDDLSLALKGSQRSGFAWSNPNQLKKSADNKLLKFYAQSGPQQEAPNNVKFLYKTLVDTQSSADYLYRTSKVHTSKAAYPATPFGRDLRQIAELMTAGAETRIFYAGLTGFDTHANQKNQQERLLQQYSDGIKAFVNDLESNGLFDNTLILTFSEFGRRVKQNASNGTDHGAASNLFLIGGKIRQAGFFNEGPNLQDLDEGDLKHSIDFRSIYATVLEKWLEVDSSLVLGKKFEVLPLLG